MGPNRHGGRGNHGGGRRGGRGGGRGGGRYCKWADPEWRRQNLHSKSERASVKVDEGRMRELFGPLTRTPPPEKREIVMRENYGREGAEEIGRIARDLGLYFKQYGKGTNTVLVVSADALPNYRAEFDHKTPEARNVTMDASARREVVDALARLEDAEREGRDATTTAGSKRYQPPNSRRGIEYGNENGRDGSGREMRYPAKFHEDEAGLSQLLMRQQEEWRASDRAKHMMKQRRRLPSWSQREELLAAVNNSQVLVVSGETGCGKTTQLPQFILESEDEGGRGATCNIICTQPRRISAMSVAQRVAEERGEGVGETVGYQIRLESRRGPRTRLLFCTTGVLLRRLVDDSRLQGVSHVIVDEIHERGMNEDFLLVILRDLLPARPDLKVILMSATLNAEMFSSYFGNAPLQHIPGLTFPVEDHFLEDVLEATGHRVTNSNQAYGGGGGGGYGNNNFGGRGGGPSRGRKASSSEADEPQAPGSMPPFNAADFEGYSSETLRSLANWEGEMLDLDLVCKTIEWVHHSQPDGAILVFLTGWDEIKKVHDMLKGHPVLGGGQNAKVLPLHGSMPTVNQREIFARPPAGVRKIVLSTNIAETSITIDDVVYVINCGKAKETTYDSVNKLACLTPMWTSRASVRQRRGRAGRVQPGKCFNLFTRTQHQTMTDYQLPELLRTPLEEIVMQIKALKLGMAKDFLNKAPQHPDVRAVDNALEKLHTIGALNRDETLTPLGRHLATLPVDPSVGKMLIMGAILGCLNPTATIAAGMAHRDPFVMPLEKKEEADMVKGRFAAGTQSDHMAALHAFEDWQRSGRHREFCWRNFLSSNTLEMMDDMRIQFIELLADIGFVTAEEVRAMRHRGSIHGSPLDAHSGDHDVLRAVICAGMYPNVVAINQGRKRATFKTKDDGKVECHPASVNSKETHFPGGWLVYNEKVLTTGIFLRDSTRVDDYGLLLFGGALENEGRGQIEMLDGYLKFSTTNEVAKLIHALRERLDNLLLRKIEQPDINVAREGAGLVDAVVALLRSQSADKPDPDGWNGGRPFSASAKHGRGGDYYNDDRGYGRGGFGGGAGFGGGGPGRPDGGRGFGGRGRGRAYP